MLLRESLKQPPGESRSSRVYPLLSRSNEKANLSSHFERNLCKINHSLLQNAATPTSLVQKDAGQQTNKISGLPLHGDEKQSKIAPAHMKADGPLGRQFGYPGWHGVPQKHLKDTCQAMVKP